MHLKGRINARKILLVYYYEQYFLFNAGKNDILLAEVEKLGNFLRESKEVKEIVLEEKMNKEYYEDMDQEISYLRKEHFSDYKDKDIDRDYLKQMGPLFWRHEETVREQVNKHVVSFNYDEMDLIDRVIFVLGYTEYLILETPKEVMINEMIELAKRYGDEQSSKLINAIGHKVLMK